MVAGLTHLALETKYLDPAVAFYREHLHLSTIEESATEVALAAGETDLILRAPSTVPRGGLHTHYAFATPAGEYAGWYDRLSEEFDLEEVTFGSAKSLYFYDIDGNCVEIGQRAEEGEGITGIFELVLEVESLDDAERFYRDLGFEVMDRGGERRRIRLTTGKFDLELWEPQLGLADARGGVHVDFGIEADPEAALAAVEDRVQKVEYLSDGVRVRDPDGHYLTFI
ncbi:VOC family protein [Natronomonas sp. EA1]|uniref:VOC family protein n=1 Tax=Natronomonas sp. EA1 TaxID=3421655 RepID=UPI003EB958F9